MTEKIISKLKRSNKLERSIILYLSLFLLFLAVILAISIILSNEKTIIRNEHNNINLVAQELTRNYEILFNDLYLTGSGLNSSIKRRVIEGMGNPQIDFDKYFTLKQKDKPLRVDNEDSGMYLASAQTMTDELSRYFFFTKRVFEVISPVATSHFFNFYFITKDDFICITPKDWVFQLEPNHDFSNDIFYKIGTPELNPERVGKWTPIYYDSIWQKWMTSLIIPVYNEDEFIGITGSDIFLEEIFGYLLDINELNLMYQTVIFDDKGNLIAHKDYMETIYQSSGEMNTLLNIENLKNPTLHKIITASLENGDKKSDVIRIKTKDDIYYLITNKIPKIGWNHTIFVSKNDLMQKSYGVIIKLIIVILLGGILILFVTRIYLKKFFLKRVTNLGVALDRVGEGQLDAKVVVNSNDEIGVLENGFVDMQESILKQFEALKYAENEIRESEEKYRTYIDNAPDGVFITDEKGHYLLVNNAACKLSGYSKEELLRMSVPDLLDQDSLADGLAHFKRTMEEGKSSGELAYRTKNGDKKYWDVEAVKLSENRFLGFVTDVTERKLAEQELEKHRDHLEDLVKERTVELEEQNEKLERFNKLFVGREFRIKELKEKLKKYEGDKD